MTFDHFNLDPRCLRALEAMKISVPTPVQDKAIPPALEGRDLVAIAQTGTGKTLGYVLPSLTRLVSGPPGNNLMLVLVPTRELCLQVHGVLKQVGAGMKMESVAIYGGVSLDRQRKSLQRGCAIVVATPGRLLDHMGRKNVSFNHLQILILDEADRMLDMGFLPDIQRILRRLPHDRHTMMFSATFPPEIEFLARTMMRDPERINVGAIRKPVETVRQVLYPVKPERKTSLMLHLLSQGDMSSTLVFCRTRSRTERLAYTLKKKGHKIAQLHGDRSQDQRQKALDGFRRGKYKILVATDVAARGLDIEGVSHVINYDIPLNPDDYLHRIGRTARAQAEGDAITFVAPEEFQALAGIERALGHTLERELFEDAPRVISLFKPTDKKRKGATRRRAPKRRLSRRK